VVDEFRAKIHHRDTETTEVAQRNLRTRTFEAKQDFRVKNSASRLQSSRLTIQTGQYPPQVIRSNLQDFADLAPN
jgi:hypothetical protein